MPGRIVACATAVWMLWIMPQQAFSFPVYADYDAELREPTPREDGLRHVDTPRLIARLGELHATTYAFLIWHQPSDFADLADEFLPAADEAGLEVWAYLVPPSEPPLPPPCYGDYLCWAETLGILAQEHPSLTAYVMDDFTSNLNFFTPTLLESMQETAHQFAPIQFLTISYPAYPYSGASLVPAFLDRDYQGVMDGVIMPFRDLDSTQLLLGQIIQGCELMKTRLAALRMSVPPSTPSGAGDFIALTAIADVTPGEHTVRFRYRSDYTGPTTGYHFIQLVVNDRVVFERDAAGDGQWLEYVINVDDAVAGASSVPLSFRIYDQRGVSNFPLVVNVYGVSAQNLSLDDGGIGVWSVSRSGSESWTATSAVRDYQGRCVLMVYTTSTSWHSAPPTVCYVTDALTIGQRGIQEFGADGVITYALNKAPDSPYFDPVAELYREWTGSP